MLCLLAGQLWHQRCHAWTPPGGSSAGRTVSRVRSGAASACCSNFFLRNTTACPPLLPLHLDVMTYVPARQCSLAYWRQAASAT